MKWFVEFLQYASPLQRNAILQTLTNQQLKVVIEIIYNVVMNVIPIPDQDKRSLKKRKRDILRTLAKGISKQNRRRRLLSIGDIVQVFVRNYLKWQSS